MRSASLFNLAMVACFLTLTFGCGDDASELAEKRDRVAPKGGSAPAAQATLDLATTTSLRDSGILAALLPEFEERTGIRVRVIAVGTGAALRMGAEGNADVLLTHAQAAEQELVDSGAVLARVPFMENFFVIAGPEEDPAGIRAATSAPDAYRKLAATESPYVSRADDSGTHKREIALMRKAGVDTESRWPGLARTGTGMGFTLQVAGERRAYVLSDIATFLAFQERIDLVVLSRNSADLRNVYAVLRVDPARFAERATPINGAGALALESFLTNGETQRRIAEFGKERFGRPLFAPLLATTASGSE